MGGSGPREDILNDRLFVVLEASAENIPVIASVGRDRHFHVAEETVALLGSRHGTPDLSPVIGNGVVNGVIEATHGLDVSSEPLTADEDISSISVGRSTAGEGTGDVVEGKSVTLLIVIFTVECQLNVHLVALGPATRRHDTDRSVIEPLSRHVFRGHVS